MTSPSYHQFCGIAHAFEVIGAPWAALVVRDLLLAPKTRADLRETLPLAGDGLDTRLRELAAAGVLRQRDGEAGGDPVYELTDYGRDLEPALLALGRWGARTLGDPRPGDLFSLDMAVLALRGAFRPELAGGLHVRYELRFGPIVVHAVVDDGVITVAEGELPGADMSIETPVLLDLLMGELTPTDALWLGLVDAKGDPGRLATFARVFAIPAGPARRAPSTEGIS